MYVEWVGGRVRLTELCASRYQQVRPLSVDGTTVRIALVGTYALLLAGDDLRIDIRVGPGITLEVIEPSGTVAYDARGGSARWRADVRLEDGARLRWRAAPLVITAGADLDREMSVDLDGDARALISELLVLGRSYEPGGGPLRSRMRVHQGARPLLVEDLDLRDRARRADPGVLGGARTLASVFLLGARPGEAVGRHETLLAGDGAIARCSHPRRT